MRNKHFLQLTVRIRLLDIKAGGHADFDFFRYALMDCNTVIDIYRNESTPNRAQ